MKTSESIKNLTKALVKAQSQMGAAAKSADNPFFRSKYAGLPQVMEVVKGPLNENGLLVLQPGVHRDGKNFINTVILHGESGEYISSETEVVVPVAKASDPQAHGSAQTYARRFGLQAMLFIPAEDSDGEDLVRDKPKSAYQGQTNPPVVTAKQLTSGTVTQGTTVGSSVQPAPTHVVSAPTVAPSVSTNTVSVNGGTQTLEPLKTSSFRNKAKPKAAPAPAIPVATDGDWS